MTLRPENIPLTVWSDFSAGTGDLLYDTSSLRTVTFAGPYTACDNAKDALRRQHDARPASLQRASAEIETTLNLSRAVGRYEIVTTDADLFRKHLGEGKIEGSSFTLRLTCDGLLACGYNCVDALRKRAFSAESPTPSHCRRRRNRRTGDAALLRLLPMRSGENLDIPQTAALLDGQGQGSQLSATPSVPLSNGMNTREYTDAS